MTSTLTTWIMEPRDPLLVRDGRPFGPDPGARATSLPFPFPSTVAGGLRTRAGVDDEGLFPFTDKDQYARELQDLKDIQIYGPLLVQLATESNEIDSDRWLLAAPRDALLLPPKATTGNASAHLERLVPLQIPVGAQTDLDQDVPWLVGQPGIDGLQKPLQEVPAYWYWEHFQTWLLDPLRLAEQLAQQTLSLSELGLRHLMQEQRIHVSIDATRYIANDGMLFETSGLEFTALGSGNKRLRLAIAVATEREIKAGLACFGGERRLVAWRQSSTPFPDCSKDIENTIVTDGHCRIILLTPACFTQGSRPTWLRADAANQKVRVEVKAVAVSRPQTVSGWDLARGKPKPSRRLVPAGSVLFLSLQGEEAAARQWIRNMWMHCISDEPEDRTDGFGLAVLGTWSGHIPMQRGGTQ